jgi:hypothetical protein
MNTTDMLALAERLEAAAQHGSWTTLSGYSSEAAKALRSLAATDGAGEPLAWQPIETAPKGRDVVVLTKNRAGCHGYLIAHWASDLSGEEQPPFEGWFWWTGFDFRQVPTSDLLKWADLPEAYEEAMRAPPAPVKAEAGEPSWGVTSEDDFDAEVERLRKIVADTVPALHWRLYKESGYFMEPQDGWYAGFESSAVGRWLSSRCVTPVDAADEFIAELAARVATPPSHAAGYAEGIEAASFQQRVAPWMLECFNAEIAADVLERGDRLLEEVLEGLQATNYPPERVTALRDYVWNRPQGEINQEVGGIMVALAAFCLATGVDMHQAAEVELARINEPEIIKKIRAKQAAKPTGSALPIAVTPVASSLKQEGEGNG